MNDVHEGRLVRPDGRTVAWSECGLQGGRPVLRLPGTPGSRLSLRADQSPWVERGLRVITAERPGFGVSTRLPGRGFVEDADDLAAILDHLGIGRVPVYGGSGGAPPHPRLRWATPRPRLGLHNRRRRRATDR
jgi:pimeloyl-ACP methyl ester carboxylesterase